ncbi:MAG: choice-of-anchor L domain-containing protein [Bacteroidetes bacterium]|nr:choice-of-anchor L domain-containing protein [Bacteroidota bacterium]
MLRTFGIYIIICFSAFVSKAQLNVSATSNAGALVNNIVGSGVQVTNVTLNCNGSASGTFSSNGTNLGISSGIILATGDAVEAIGPNNSSGGSGFSSVGCFSSGESFFDPNVLGIEPEAKYDGCALEFDVKPVCNTLNINYVFASEEYPEFVGAGYNDAFGFFVWGPNPSGGSYSGTNIAKVPGTGIPVAIDNINGGSFSQYYVDNSGGSTIEYDGFTKPLVASINVTPCSIYHLKLVIADAGDCLYSSAVFLSHKGLTCSQSEVPQNSVSTTPISCGNDGTATVTVTGYSNPITYNWQPGGQTTATATNLGSGTYTCTLGFSLPCPFTQTVTATLTGNNILNLNTSSTNSYCNNPSGTASVVTSGGIPPYSPPTWNTIPPQSTNSINNLLPGTYSVTLSDASGCTVTKSIVVGNTSPNIIITDSIINSTCNSANGAVFIKNITGGTQPYSYNWDTSPISTSQNLTNIFPGVYSLTITDIDGCTKTENFTVNNLDSVLLSIKTINEYCNQRNGEINVSIINGVAPYNWDWSHSATLNNSSASGLSAGPYSFTVTDAAGCVSNGSAIITNIRDLFSGEIYTRPAEPIVNIDFALGVTLPPTWDITQIVLSDGTIRTNETEVMLNYPEYGYYNSTFYLISENGCLDTVKYTIFIKDFMTIYIPNAFTPNRDVRNNVWFVYGTLVKEIQILVYNRWGEKLFESNDIEKGWDGTYKGKMCQEDMYIYKVVAKDYFNEEKKLVGHINLFR